MLAEKSSMTIAVKGWVSFSKTLTICGLPLSRIVNWSRSRSGTRRPCASVTVVNSGTNCVPDRKIGCCASPVRLPPAATAPAIRAAVITRNVTRRVTRPGVTREAIPASLATVVPVSKPAGVRRRGATPPGRPRKPLGGIICGHAYGLSDRVPVVDGSRRVGADWGLRRRHGFDRRRRVRRRGGGARAQRGRTADRDRSRRAVFLWFGPGRSDHHRPRQRVRREVAARFCERPARDRTGRRRPSSSACR